MTTYKITIDGKAFYIQGAEASWEAYMAAEKFADFIGATVTLSEANEEVEG